MINAIGRGNGINTTAKFNRTNNINSSNVSFGAKFEPSFEKLIKAIIKERNQKKPAELPLFQKAVDTLKKHPSKYTIAYCDVRSPNGTRFLEEAPLTVPDTPLTRTQAQEWIMKLVEENPQTPGKRNLDLILENLQNSETTRTSLRLQAENLIV